MEASPRWICQLKKKQLELLNLKSLKIPPTKHYLVILAMMSWVLKSYGICIWLIPVHLSCCSCDPMPNMFKRMFKTSPAAQKFQAKKDNNRYIMPYIQNISWRSIFLSLWFSVLFDESFNHHQQKCHIDVNIYYWNKNQNLPIMTPDFYNDPMLETWWMDYSQWWIS